MRLHNFCIDKRIGEEEINKFNMDGHVAIPVPGEVGKTKDRWRRTPVYKDGKPVTYLLEPTLPPAAAASPLCGLRGYSRAPLSCGCGQRHCATIADWEAQVKLRCSRARFVPVLRRF